MDTVKIRLRKPTRVYTFLSSGISLKRDDPCIVKSDRGLEWGVCILPPEPCPAQLEKRLKMNVIRKATPGDETTFGQIQTDEHKAREMCAARIESRKLPMKLVDVEYTFDKQKVIFYFTAADRVDFRELVRDLAQELKTRIELRHIQVRDEAKIVGGLGVCGRELCCSTWLTEFKPISMKMAKRQNLSLNPSKISGQCGRLLCCLGYENELYVERKRAERMTQEAGGPLETSAPDEQGEASRDSDEDTSHEMAHYLSAVASYINPDNGEVEADAAAELEDAPETQPSAITAARSESDTPEAAEFQAMPEEAVEPGQDAGPDAAQTEPDAAPSKSRRRRRRKRSGKHRGGRG